MMLIRVGAFASGRPPLDAKAEDESGKSGHSETWPGSEQLPSLFLCFDTISTSMNFQTIISATQSRKKQQTELVRSVLFAEKDKKRQENNNDDDDGDDGDDDDGDGDDDDSDDIPIMVS